MDAALPRTPAELHVLVAGAGGIGCPAAWGLAASGVGRITLLDPDVVELSNLPRQVLYSAADVGRAKAPTASARLPADVFVGGVHARLDDTNQTALLEDVDVVIDATDGAHAKDWINQLAVRRGLPLVHAAGLRAEARLMSVRAGGRPCLACLFGRLTEETGSCADLGVWNGVVGTVGFLAAQAALDLALDLVLPGTQAGDGYAVLDFETGRAMTLGARAEAACPVCAQAAAVEAYPEAPACAAPDVAPAAAAWPKHDAELDLRDEHCPLNLVRARKALSELKAGRLLYIRLGQEGAATVPDGVRALGHRIVQRAVAVSTGELDLLVASAGGTDAERLDGESLQRFARQVVLPEVGEAGQRRLAAARVCLRGAGPAYESARVYLEAAGVGRVTSAPAEGPDGDETVAWAGGSDVPEGFRADAALVLEGDACHAALGPPRMLGRYDVPVAVALAWGTLLADLVQRRIVLPDGARQRTFSIARTGVVR